MRLQLCHGHLGLDDRRHLDDLGNRHLVRHLGLHLVRRLDGHRLRHIRHVRRRRDHLLRRLLRHLGHRRGHPDAVLLHYVLASCLGLDVVHPRLRLDVVFLDEEYPDAAYLDVDRLSAPQELLRHRPVRGLDPESARRVPDLWSGRRGQVVDLDVACLELLQMGCYLGAHRDLEPDLGSGLGSDRRLVLGPVLGVVHPDVGFQSVACLELLQTGCCLGADRRTGHPPRWQEHP